MTRPDPADRTGFRDIKADILSRILSGEWGADTILPGEVELAQRYSCARATVNRALTELADDGVIERRKRAGTRVRPAPRRQARFSIPVVRDEIEASGARYGYRLLQRELAVPPADCIRRLGLRPGKSQLHLTGLHFADHVPFQVEDRWISLEALPKAAETDFSEIGPNEWLIREVPYSDVEISFLASAAEGVLAEAFQVADATPLFTVERLTWWKGAGITQVRLYYGAGYRMTTRY